MTEWQTAARELLGEHARELARDPMMGECDSRLLSPAEQHLVEHGFGLLDAALVEHDGRRPRARGAERPVEIDRQLTAHERLCKLRDMAKLDGGGYGRELADMDREAITWALAEIDRLTGIVASFPHDAWQSALEQIARLNAEAVALNMENATLAATANREVGELRRRAEAAERLQDQQAARHVRDQERIAQLVAALRLARPWAAWHGLAPSKVREQHPEWMEAFAETDDDGEEAMAQNAIETMDAAIAASAEPG